jgi:hypothetical protein
MTPPAPTRMREVAAAMAPTVMAGAELPMPGEPWCSAIQ